MKKTRIMSAALISAALLGSISLASPAFAGQGNAGGIGSVCVAGAGEGSVVSVSESPATANNARSFADAERTLKARAGGAALAAQVASQIALNDAYGISTTRTIDGTTANYVAVTDGAGCVTVPTTGNITTAVGVKVGAFDATATYANETVAMVGGVITHTDAVTTSDPRLKAPRRTITHTNATSGTAGFNLTVE